MNMKRIGVVSDTHGSLPESVFQLFSGAWANDELQAHIADQYDVEYGSNGVPSQLREQKPAHDIANVPCDLVIHAGDIGPQMVLDELGAIAPTIAVLGNNDYDHFWTSDEEVQQFRTFAFDGLSIAVQHRPADLRASLHGRSVLQPPLVKTQPALAIHGHTHVPFIQLQPDGQILLCPGSPTRARNGSGHQVALVDTEGPSIRTISFMEV